MRETLIYLSHLDHEDTEKQVLQFPVNLFFVSEVFVLDSIYSIEEIVISS